MEGLDFSGKSTLVENLRTLLSDLVPPPHFTREPGGTPTAERVRAMLLDPELEMDPWTEAYLYAAARADLVRREILPRLEDGRIVLCERFLDSSIAYQGAGRGLGVAEVRKLNAWAVGEVVPDLTFYLRLPPEERARRASESGAPLDRIEQVGDDFVRRVEEGFEEIARSEPDRVKVLNASSPPEELAETVGRRVRRLWSGDRDF
ncbi:MAG: Thymidylate kinase [uncultured Rubrobacteraceae bacterium]|uniref:Thymidylate kinase n=1 Tax=uncultured Rubrobacteraceae bacterium TaxID=349277 RepID=A0A6J4PZ73_9ACTN|nr:MAG: Thymidylate kinase [uncultured Rubrobacteraceae bacterium]